MSNSNLTPSTDDENQEFLSFLRNTSHRSSRMATKRDKSEQTLALIVRTALDISVVEGVHAISLGDVAKRMGISKSGVFARVGSIEALQNLVLAEYERIFSNNVFLPALDTPRGLPRLHKIMSLWIGRGVGAEAMGGAMHASSAFDLDHVDSPLRERLMQSASRWRKTLERTIHQAVQEGHLRADTDPAQVSFELHSMMLGYLHEARFMRSPVAADRAIAAYQRVLNGYLPTPQPS